MTGRKLARVSNSDELFRLFAKAPDLCSTPVGKTDDDSSLFDWDCTEDETPVFESRAEQEEFFVVRQEEVAMAAEQASFPAAPHTQRLLRRRAEQLIGQCEDGGARNEEELEQEAARLFLQYQALTFQHLFLHQYSKRLVKLAIKKAGIYCTFFYVETYPLVMVLLSYCLLGEKQCCRS